MCKYYSYVLCVLLFYFFISIIFGRLFNAIWWLTVSGYTIKMWHPLVIYYYTVCMYVKSLYGLWVMWLFIILYDDQSARVLFYEFTKIKKKCAKNMSLGLLILLCWKLVGQSIGNQAHTHAFRHKINREKKDFYVHFFFFLSSVDEQATKSSKIWKKVFGRKSNKRKIAIDQEQKKCAAYHIRIGLVTSFTVCPCCYFFSSLFVFI